MLCFQNLYTFILSPHLLSFLLMNVLINDAFILRHYSDWSLQGSLARDSQLSRGQSLVQAPSPRSWGQHGAVHGWPPQGGFWHLGEILAPFCLGQTGLFRSEGAAAIMT